jgi:hypothetical protein
MAGNATDRVSVQAHWKKAKISLRIQCPEAKMGTKLSCMSGGMLAQDMSWNRPRVMPLGSRIADAIHETLWSPDPWLRYTRRLAVVMGGSVRYMFLQL